MTREELANTMSRSAQCRHGHPADGALPADVTALLDARRVDQSARLGSPSHDRHGPAMSMPAPKL